MSLMKWQFVLFGFHSNAGYISLNEWKGPQMDTVAQLEIPVYREADILLSEKMIPSAGLCKSQAFTIT